MADNNEQSLEVLLQHYGWVGLVSPGLREDEPVTAVAVGEEGPSAAECCEQNPTAEHLGRPS